MRSRAGVALALGVLLLATSSVAAAVRVRIVPRAPRQGDVAVIFLAGLPGARRVE